MDALASETVINMSNFPLATYPAEIKSAIKRIDAGKQEDAKKALHQGVDLGHAEGRVRAATKRLAKPTPELTSLLPYAGSLLYPRESGQIWLWAEYVDEVVAGDPRIHRNRPSLSHYWNDG